jgi:PAS domain S-box-containing protein
VGLFVGVIYGVIVPDVERNLLDRKRDTIRELTRSAQSVLQEYHQEEKQGLLSREEAQRGAAARIRDLRYGAESKDYFWITDMQPVMVMHPFRTDLDGKDLSEFRDPLGNRVFVECVHLVRSEGSGYLDYVWQWKDDPSRLVPKESFVMGFEPWGWIIGTGIYVEDVQQEIQRLTQRLVRISLSITGLIALILLFVAHQSLKIERQRNEAEDALRASHEKYRALVEAATEGTLLLSDDVCTFANPTMCEMLGYEPEEIEALDAKELLPPEGPERDGVLQYFRAVSEGQPAPVQFDAQLRRKDGELLDVLLSATRIAFAGKSGLIVNAKDVTRFKRVEEELGYSRARFRELRDTIDFGVFRTTVGPNARVIEANPSARRILGLSESGDLTGTDLLEACSDPEERQALSHALNTQGVVKNRVLPIQRKDGSIGTVSLTAVLVPDANGFMRYCDGFVEDVTEHRRVEGEREAIIAELQTSLLFLNEPIVRYVQKAAQCDLNTPIRKAAELLGKSQGEVVFVVTESREPVGIVTDRDLRERVVATGLDPESPLFRVMTSPLVTVSERALVYEALQLMRESNIQHVAVRKDAGPIVGVLRQADLSHFHRYSPAVLIQEIRQASTTAELAAARTRVPSFVRTLIEAGARSRNVNRVVTSVSDAITERLVALTQRDLGPAPARFAFVALGSEGREEQTLVTDQDNAILYEEVSDDEQGLVEEYFQQLGTRVCDALAQVGYAYCPGEVMAKNPKWCKPLPVWKRYFSGWIEASNPQDLLSINMFFDLRCLVGDRTLVGDLRRHIRAQLQAHPGFFPLFAKNALLYKAPLGLFGNIVADSEGRGPKTFSIKEAMMPVVNFARLYALQGGISETNTFDRLRALHERNVLKKSTHDEVWESYAFLMQIRLSHQAAASAEGLPPSNAIDPKSLSPIEEATLKKTFGHVAILQKKIGFDFLRTG